MTSRRFLPGLALASLLLGCGGAAPAPDLRVGSDPRVATDVPVSAAGRLEQPQDLSLRLGRPERCGPGSTELTGRRVAAGAIRLRGVARVEQPGGYELCLVGRAEGRARVLARRRLEVRAPHAEVQIATPAVGAAYEPVEVRLRGSTELPAELALYLAGSDVPCRSRDEPTGTTPEATAAVAGAFAVTMRADLDDGPQVLCAVLRGGSGSPRVLATTRAEVLGHFEPGA